MARRKRYQIRYRAFLKCCIYFYITVAVWIDLLHCPPPGSDSMIRYISFSSLSTLKVWTVVHVAFTVVG